MHLDGIHLHRDTVVLIAVSGGHVVGWHVARSETCSAWSSLLSRIAPPHRRASRTSEQPPSGWRRTTSESGTSPDSSTRRAVGRTASSRTSTCTWPRPAGWCTDGSGMGSHSRSSTAGRVRGADPSSSKLIESWSARIRDMLRHHRGLSLARRIKAIC